MSSSVASPAGIAAGAAAATAAAGAASAATPASQGLNNGRGASIGPSSSPSPRNPMAGLGKAFTPFGKFMGKTGNAMRTAAGNVSGGVMTGVGAAAGAIGKGLDAFEPDSKDPCAGVLRKFFAGKTEEVIVWTLLAVIIIMVLILLISISIMSLRLARALRKGTLQENICGNEYMEAETARYQVYRLLQGPSIRIIQKFYQTLQWVTMAALVVLGIYLFQFAVTAGSLPEEAKAPKMRGLLVTGIVLLFLVFGFVVVNGFAHLGLKQPKSVSWAEQHKVAVRINGQSEEDLYPESPLISGAKLAGKNFFKYVYQKLSDFNTVVVVSAVLFPLLVWAMSSLAIGGEDIGARIMACSKTRWGRIGGFGGIYLVLFLSWVLSRLVSRDINSVLGGTGMAYEYQKGIVEGALGELEPALGQVKAGKLGAADPKVAGSYVIDYLLTNAKRFYPPERPQPDIVALMNDHPDGLYKFLLHQNGQEQFAYLFRDLPGATKYDGQSAAAKKLRTEMAKMRYTNPGVAEVRAFVKKVIFLLILVVLIFLYAGFHTLFTQNPSGTTKVSVVVILLLVAFLGLQSWVTGNIYR